MVIWAGPILIPPSGMHSELKTIIIMSLWIIKSAIKSIFTYKIKSKMR